MKRFWAALLLPGFLYGTSACADTLLLKSGRKLEGILVSADDAADLELQVGSGKLILRRDEVALITRSDDAEKDRLEQVWARRKLENEAAFQQGFAQERIRRVKESRELQPLQPKTANLVVSGGNLYVEAAVNDQPARTFLLDTGAPYVVLSRRSAEELGVDFKQQRQIFMTRIAGYQIQSMFVKLDKVEIDGFWVRHVEALVYLETGEDLVYNQNILGMSYLQNFHFEINTKKNLLTLSWEGA